MEEDDKLFKEANRLLLSGEINSAQKIYLLLVKKNKNNDKLFFLLGTTYLQLKKYDSALKYLLISSQLNPNFPDTFNNIGVALAETGKFLEALKNYDQAIVLKINYTDAYLNKAIALNNLYECDKALKCIDKVFKLDFKNVKAFNTLGNIYQNKGENKNAFLAYKKAFTIKPNYLEAISNGADVLHGLKKNFEALILLNKIYSQDPDFYGLLGKIYSNKIAIGDWSDYKEITKKIKEKISKRLTFIEPLDILYMTDNSSLIKINSEEYINNNKKTKIYKSQKVILKNKLHIEKKSKIKIGYFSAEFHNHPVLHAMKEIFKNHDKSKFEVYAFSHGKFEEDSWRKEIKIYFDKFYKINDLSDDQVIELANNLQIDIAINLTGITNNSRTSIFQKRVAPIQVSYCGFPSTIGSKSIDYIIADRIIIPEEYQNYFTENVEYLPTCYLPKPNRGKIKTSLKNKYHRKDFNLPENKIVFCAFCNPKKITPEIFNLWINIIKKVDGSILWLSARNNNFIDNIKKELKKENLNIDRVKFSEKVEKNEDHLEKLKLADIFLDTYPYNSHSTIYDYMEASLPMVSMQGRSYASRVSASVYAQIELNNLIATNKLDYENIAVELAKDKLKLKNTKDKIKNYLKNANHFDNKKFTKELENIYQKIFKQAYSLS